MQGTRIFLGTHNRLTEAPEWWQKLVNNTDGCNGKKARDEIMKQYHASIVRDTEGEIVHIQFEQSHYYTWFILNLHTDPNFN